MNEHGISERHEDEVCKLLSAFIEEWGHDRMTLRVPKPWINFEETALWDGKVRLENCGDNSVFICVDGGSSQESMILEQLKKQVVLQIAANRQ